MVKPISVSIRASRVFVQSLKALADSKGVRVADLTKKAIDDCLGNELAPFLVFFTSNVNPDGQSTISIDNTVGGAKEE